MTTKKHKSQHDILLCRKSQGGCRTGSHFENKCGLAIRELGFKHSYIGDRPSSFEYAYSTMYPICVHVFIDIYIYMNYWRKR